MPQVQILLVGATCAFLYLIARVYAARSAVWKLQRANLPMPAFTLLGGHFGALKEIMKTMPPKATIHTVIKQLSTQFPSGMFYVNMWPFFGTWLIVTTPSGAAQCQALNLRKPDILTAPLEVVAGGPTLVAMHGQTWKWWRSLLNPGFNPTYMLGLAPLVAEEVAVFCKLLRQRARQGKVFQLEEMTLRLTVDTIAAVALDTRLHHQIQDNPLATTLQRQIEWTSFGTTLNPIKRFLTLRPLVLWYNNRLMDRLIGAEVDKRYAEHLAELEAGTPHKRSKSVMSLALAKYLEEQSPLSKPTVTTAQRMSLPQFKRLLAPQLRGFLFGGRDTTSSTLLYCYHLLATNPSCLARVLAEHDAVFGPGPSGAHALITSDPNRLNQLPYTTAAIKEVLRLFPPAASMREGKPGVELVDDEGRKYPTEGCNVWNLTVALHNNGRYWKDVNKFMPERWLAGPEDEMYPAKGAWRAFEFGPRGCIGQTLAMTELKVALVMTLREFEISPAYEEWDEMFPREGVKTVGGNRAFQAEKGAGGAHPADGFPCRVVVRA